jgi:hypothetical protein
MYPETSRLQRGSNILYVLALVSHSFWVLRYKTLLNLRPSAALSSDLVGYRYRSRRPSIAFNIVTSSAYSRSAPTGIPTPMRVTRTPKGLSNFER